MVLGQWLDERVAVGQAPFMQPRTAESGTWIQGYKFSLDVTHRMFTWSTAH